MLRQLAHVGRAPSGRGAIMPQSIGYQDMGGRVTRYPLRGTEKTDGRQACATSSSATAGWTP